MIRDAPFTWRLGVASLSLLLAVAVYCFARIYPPELLGPFQVTKFGLTENIEIFGSAPSFFYTLALGLFIGACTSTRASARIHCLLWIGVAVCLEISQYLLASEPLKTWLAESLSVSVWELVGPYWTHGAFDTLDLLATVFGGLIALAIITYFPAKHDDECS